MTSSLVWEIEELVYFVRLEKNKLIKDYEAHKFSMFCCDIRDFDGCCMGFKIQCRLRTYAIFCCLLTKTTFEKLAYSNRGNRKV